MQRGVDDDARKEIAIENLYVLELMAPIVFVVSFTETFTGTTVYYNQVTESIWTYRGYHVWL